MYAHEVAMDELAVACGLDPIVLRERNEPDLDPETGKPFNDRRLLDCLHRGAERFGWAARPAEPRARLEGDWWVGTGVAVGDVPRHEAAGQQRPGHARSTDGRYAVAIGSVDIGTGARTVLTQIAADALEVDPARRRPGRSPTASLPPASVAGGSSGTSSWGSAIVAAAQLFRADHGASPDPGLHTDGVGGRRPRGRDLRLPLLRRGVRRGAGQPVDRRGAGAAPARRLLRGPGRSTRGPPAPSSSAAW